MADVFDLHTGTEPLIVSIPHSGTELPDDLKARLTPAADGLPDTDWYVDRLYAFARDLGATIIKANYSRYVVDLNRDPTGASLYPGQATTGFLPTERFDGETLYTVGDEPDEAEIEQRRGQYFDPYHRTISENLARLRAINGYVILYDAHSIASHVPRLFDGELPVLNLGTNGGQSCGREIEQAATKAMLDQEEFEAIANGRFKGGWITRSYGRPQHNVHAIQMELAQRAYMDEASGAYDAARAGALQPVLKTVMERALAAAEKLHWEISK
tara:strand:- start:1936 stop:2748 length:813 start_codon:yes stop_codon:yes gene_type:complete